MKKIINNRIVQISFICLAVILLILLCFKGRVDENVSTRVSRVLKPKYDKIECANKSCKYVLAYKENKKGKTTVSIINSKGKTIAKYKEDFSDPEEITRKVADVSDKYIIFSLEKEKYEGVYGYKVTTKDGKEILESNQTINKISDDLLYEVGDNVYTIYNSEGKVLYKDVQKMEFYSDKKVITFVKDDLVIIDNKGNTILDGYKVVEEIKDNDDKSLYLVVEAKQNEYYYYDSISYKIVGEYFNSYVKLDDGKLLVSKKENNKTNKYEIDKNGIFTKSSKLLNKELYNKLTKKISKNTYEVITDSIVNDKQTVVLVKNTVDNSFGIYQTEKGLYDKLFDFKSDDRTLSVYKLYEDRNNSYIQVGCTSDYCTEDTVVIYNILKNEIAFKLTGNANEVRNFIGYEDNYKVVKFRNNKYALYDNENNEVLTSDNKIVIVDKQIIFGDENDTSNVILYSVSKKELLNDDNSLASINKETNYTLYTFSDKDYMYLYDKNGKLIKKINLMYSNINYGDKYISYLGDKKINLISLITNKTISLKVNEKELVDLEEKVISPYKGTLVLTNSKKKEIRVVNYYKKTLKTLTNTTLEDVKFDEKNNSIFMIIKQDKKYGLYIIK